MTPYHATPDATFFVGDCRAVLATLAAESVHAAITSPPYFGLRKYEGVGPSVWDDPGGCAHEWGSIERGKRKDILPEDQTTLVSRTGVDDRQNGAATNGGRFCLKCPAWLGMLGLEPDPDLFCSHLVEVFRAVKRVLRRDGLLFVNLGSSYAGSGKGPQSGREHKVWNRDDAPRGTPDCGVPAKCDLCIPDRFRLAMVADGWIVRVRSVPWIKRSCMPGSQQDRPTVATEDWIMLAKSGRYHWDQEAVRRQDVIPFGGKDEGYAPASKDHHLTSQSPIRHGTGRMGNSPGGRSLRTTDGYFDSLDSLIADTRRTLAHLERIRERGGLLLDDDGLPLALDVTSSGSDLEHYASYPLKVVEPWILGGSPQEVCADCGAGYVRVTERVAVDSFEHGDIERGKAAHWKRSSHTGHNDNAQWRPPVTLGWAKSCHCPTDARQSATILDCFLGSGTTAVAARRLGRRVIGIDASQFYVDMAIRRLEGITPTLPTPSPRPPPATQLALGEGR